MAVPGKATKRPFPPVLATLLCTAAVMALGYGLHFYTGRWLAASWQEQLETAPDEQLPILVDRLAQMEEKGFPALVQALDSPRESVARAARQRLWQEIDHWESLRTRQASRNAICLAQTLADQVEGFGPDGQKNAVDLAARILDWPVDDEIVRARNVMAACERVIRTSGLPRPIWASRSPAGRTDAEPALESARRTMVEADAQDGAVKQLTYLSGGGLPIVSSLASPVEEAAADGPTSTPSAGEASAGAKSAAQQTAAPTSKTPGQPANGEPSPLAPEDGKPLLKASTPAGADLLGRGLAPPQNREGGASKQLLLTDTLELMRRLRSDNTDAAKAAREELQRRGFTEVHMELARQMFDPDPEVRRQLARMLPELRSVNSTPWLVWLCRDRDAEVRLLAITLLATSNDPAVIAQVERIARADDDPRIQDQAQRLARHRGENQPSRTR